MVVRKLRHILYGHTPTESDLLEQYRLKVTPTYTSLLSYRQPEVQSIIKLAKYHRNSAAVKALAEVLQLYEKTLVHKPVHFVPIPQHYHRWRERGFHHVTDIITQAGYDPVTILYKQTHTKRQAHVDQQTRRLQQRGSFGCEVHHANDLQGTVILFDDVLTTGSTMKAAQETLLPHLPAETQLHCVTLADA